MTKIQTIEEKLSLLYDKLYNIEDFASHQQRQYLSNEIDYYKTELLKLQLAEDFKQIENEASKD